MHYVKFDSVKIAAATAINENALHLSTRVESSIHSNAQRNKIHMVQCSFQLVKKYCTKRIGFNRLSSVAQWGKNTVHCTVRIDWAALPSGQEYIALQAALPSGARIHCTAGCVAQWGGKQQMKK